MVLLKKALFVGHKGLNCIKFFLTWYLFFRIESDVEVATRTLSKENQEQNEEKLSGEILQSSDVGMDNNDATKFDSSNITNDKLNPSWVLESPIFM